MNVNGGRSNKEYINRNFKTYYTDAIKIATSLRIPWIQLDDKISLALVALVNAIKNYNPKKAKGTKFGTYLYSCIRNILTLEIYALNKTPLSDTVRVSWKEKTKKGTIVERHKIIPNVFVDTSVVEDDDDSKVASLEKLVEEPTYEKSLEIREFIKLLRKRLSTNQNKVLNMLINPTHFVLNYRKYNLEKQPIGFNETTIAKILGCSRQRVNQIVFQIRKEAELLKKWENTSLINKETGELLWEEK